MSTAGSILVKIAYYVNWHIVDLSAIFVCLLWGLFWGHRGHATAETGGISY